VVKIIREANELRIRVSIRDLDRINRFVLDRIGLSVEDILSRAIENEIIKTIDFAHLCAEYAEHRSPKSLHSSRESVRRSGLSNSARPAGRKGPHPAQCSPPTGARRALRRTPTNGYKEPSETAPCTRGEGDEECIWLGKNLFCPYAARSLLEARYFEQDCPHAPAGVWKQFKNREERLRSVQERQPSKEDPDS